MYGGRRHEMFAGRVKSKSRSTPFTSRREFVPSPANRFPTVLIILDYTPRLLLNREDREGSTEERNGGTDAIRRHWFRESSPPEVFM